MNEKRLLYSLSHIEKQKQKSERQNPVELIAKASDLLHFYYGSEAIPSNVQRIFDQLDKESKRLQPLGEMVLNRKPNPEEIQSSEGRGFRILSRITKDKYAHVYSKGTGARSRFEKGFTNSLPINSESIEKDIFFDDVQYNSHPRIQGTETMSWGYMELINCFLLFISLVENKDLQSLEDCLQAQISIPLFLNYFPLVTQELTAKLDNLKTKYSKILKEPKLNTDPRKAKKNQNSLTNLDWIGNKYLGSVSAIVPSNIRLADYSDDSESNAISKYYHNIKTPSIASNTGKTLRNMIESGISMSSSSSHYGNMYVAEESECAIADYSDFVFLGEYSTDEQIAMICDTLKAKEGITPPIAPSLDHEYSYIECHNAIKLFLQELLLSIVDKDKLEYLTDLYMSEFEAAKVVIAKLLVSKYKSPQWQKIVDTRKRIVTNPKTHKYDLEEELNRKIKSNLNEQTVLEVKSQDSNSQINEILTYLQSPIEGEYGPLTQDLTKFINLRNCDTKYPSTLDSYLKYENTKIHQKQFELSGGKMIKQSELFEPAISVFLDSCIAKEDPHLAKYYQILDIASTLTRYSAQSRFTSKELSITDYPSRILAGEDPVRLLHEAKCDNFTDMIDNMSSIIVDRNSVLPESHSPRSEFEDDIIFIPLFPFSILQSDITNLYSPRELEKYFSFANRLMQHYYDSKEIRTNVYQELLTSYKSLANQDKVGIMEYELGYTMFRYLERIDISDPELNESLKAITLELEQRYTVIDYQNKCYEVKGDIDLLENEKESKYPLLSQSYLNSGKPDIADMYSQLIANNLNIYSITRN